MVETNLPKWTPGLGMSAWDDESNYIGDRFDGYFVLSKHRDSDALGRSNYTVALERLEALDTDATGCVVELSFNHWAVGYVDQICLKANAPENIIREAEKIREELRDYPILDESHYSDLEYNEAAEYWNSMSPREKVRYAMDVRSHYHWLAKEPVWYYGRMDLYQVVETGSTISQGIWDSLRE